MKIAGSSTFILSMRPVFICSMAILLLVSVSRQAGRAQIFNTDYSRIQRETLYHTNKVWMVYGWTYKYVKGIQEKKGRKSSFERFDRQGNRTEEIFYDPKGTPEFSCQFLFDETGAEIKRVGGARDEVIYEKWVYTSSDNGRKIERKSEYKKGKDQKWVYAINEFQNKLEETYYDLNGMIAYKWVFQYDLAQNLIEKREYDAYGNIYQRWVFTYDDKGNNTELHHYVSGGQLQRVFKMQYDKKGNMKAKFVMDKDENILELIVYVYQFYDGLHAPRTTGNKK